MFKPNKRNILLTVILVGLAYLSNYLATFILFNVGVTNTLIDYVFSVLSPFGMGLLQLPVQLIYSYLLASAILHLFRYKDRKIKFLSYFVLYFTVLDVSRITLYSLWRIGTGLYIMLVISGVFLLFRLNKKSDTTIGWLHIFFGGRLVLNLLAIVFSIRIINDIVVPSVFILLHAGVWFYFYRYLKLKKKKKS